VSGKPYREPLPVPPDPYLLAWEDLRRRRAAMLRAGILCVPVSLLAATLVGGPGLMVTLPAMGAAALASLRWSTFECPRCGQYFMGRRSSTDRACARCGLKEGTPRSASSDVAVTPF
jgi:hypothetical protein